MLTEYEVRRRLEEIESSDLSPSEQAKLVIKLGRTLRIQATTLAESATLAAQGSDPLAARRLLRLSTSSRDLHEQMRREALRLLKPPFPRVLQTA